MSMPEIKSQPVRNSIHWLVGLFIAGWIILSIVILVVVDENYSPRTFQNVFLYIFLSSTLVYLVLIARHGAIMLPIILLAGILQCGGCVNWIGYRSGLSGPVRAACCNHLHQIGLALDKYQKDHGTFPPAYVADKNGEPICSWTVPILPYLDEKYLYEKLNPEEPWNSPHNKLLTEKCMPLLQCPTHMPRRYRQNNHIGYVGVVGPNTAWPGAVGRPLSEFTDGPENTILLFEVAALDIPWAAPPTLDLDTAIERFTKRDPHGPSSRHHPANISVLMADGTPRSLPGDIPPETLRALLTVNGGETVVIPEPAPESSLP